MKIDPQNLSNKYLRKLKDSIFQISHAVHDADNIDILFKRIHQEITSLVHTNNFYIALYEKESNTISFPYYVDINDPIPKESIELGTGLTSLILKSKKSCLIDKNKYLQLVEDGFVSRLGTAPESFLGVPLILHDKKAIGILAIQSYTKEIIFNQNDLDVLCFISEQIALAIEKFNSIDNIEKKSKYDEGTKLPNKTLFFDIASREIVKSDKILLFVLIDIDDFMLIVEAHGPDIGTEIIKKISTRLKNNIHNGETASYWGLDKFNLILKSDSSKNVQKRIEDLMELIHKPINIHDLKFQVNPSIGVSVFPDNSRNLNELIRDSQIAVHYVKNNGKNNYKFYKHSIKENLMNQFGLEVGLREAIANQQWELYYQPKFNSSNSIYGFEALIRWDHPQRGIISPLDFIPIAEKSNQINEIGKFVINNVCHQIKKWVDQGHQLVGSINLSAKQLEKDSIINDIKSALDHSGLDPQNLEIEITESIMMKNEKQSMKILNKIKELGVFLSIDDFGTGYSSFNYLNEMPVDIIKIDKSFVTGIDKEDEKYKIANTIIKMANELKISVIAEGVETQHEFKALESAKCSKYQGYYFSKPLTSNEFEKIL